MMTYQQYIDVLIQNDLLDHEDLGTVSKYEQTLELYNDDEQLQEQYESCLEWFNDLVSYEKMNGL